jgi:hypothetical protein
LFDDGSYEGDVSLATELAARPLAAEFQRKRLQGLIDNIVADSSLDETAKLARILAELPKLPEKDDPELLEQLRMRFPGLSSNTSSLIEGAMRSALATEKQGALRSLKRFENSTKSGFLNLPLLAQCWNDLDANE